MRDTHTHVGAEKERSFEVEKGDVLVGENSGTATSTLMYLSIYLLRQVYWRYQNDFHLPPISRSSHQDK